MGLLKDMDSNIGVKLTYHRVASFNVITNSTILITVKSYFSKEDREEEPRYLEEKRLRFALMDKDPKDLTVEEKVLLESPEPTFSTYEESRLISAPYQEDMSVTDAYEYLKTLPEFEGAIDD